MENIFHKNYLRAFRPPDLAVAVMVLALLYSILSLGKSLAVPFHAGHSSGISLSPSLLPYYAGESVLRMFIAYAASLVFSLVYGYACAYSKSASRILIPFLDILQSVPVLGFLSITVTGFMALFPGSLMGLELASIFAIFTSQAWNITFSFYHSLLSIPGELREASRLYRLNPWQRFSQLELPHAMSSLIWNSMLSFGGSWLFLTASEAITVTNQQIKLPGIGSYLALAISSGNGLAILYALLTMAIVIITLDQLFWRPLLAWSERYNSGEGPETSSSNSAILTILRRSRILAWTQDTLLAPLGEIITNVAGRLAPFKDSPSATGRRAWPYIILTSLVATASYLAYEGILLIISIPAHSLLTVTAMGLATAVRVAAAVILSALWTIPAGVYIGLNRKAAALLRPLAQIFSSFPINMLFPLFTVIYLYLHVNFQSLGSIILMMLGTQWYILFNVIAGTQAIPEELKEATAVMGLSGFDRWRHFLLPAIFPALITGGITAAGNAWNSSILAEVVTWKDHTLTAFGLGSYIAAATSHGDSAALFWGIVVMSSLVVLVNSFFWRPLYRMAEGKFKD